jgi:hypothetical protein
MAKPASLRLIISGCAVGLLVAQFLSPRLKLEPVALGLAVLAVLPWLSTIIESAKLPGGWEVKFREVEREQARQREDLDAVLRFLLENFVTDHELVHLKKLASGEPFPFKKSDAFEGELRRLLGLRLIERRSGRGIRSLFRVGDDVGSHLLITDRGREYLKHRESLKELDVT